MAKIEFIIHPSCIEIELRNPGLRPEERTRAEEALCQILEVIRNSSQLVIVDELIGDGLSLTHRPEGDVFVLQDVSPSLVRSLVQSGDDVTMYGAFRRLCVDMAAYEAMQAGATVSVSLQGTIA